MSRTGEIGELRETRNEIRVEWQISDFFSLSEKVAAYHESPRFPLSDSIWCLRIYPNGDCDETAGWIGLYLRRKDSGPSKSVTWQLSIKKADCTTMYITNVRYTFGAKLLGYGCPNIIERSQLLRKKSELAPSNVLIIIAVLKSEDPHPMNYSLFSRSRRVISNLEDILAEGTQSDVVLKTEQKEMKAHRLIIGTRSPVFEKMFCHEMLENQTGVVRISDVESDVLECILAYMYTGEVKGISPENMCKVYLAADKYDLPELKTLCMMFMEENLSVKVICDVIKIVDMYEEPKLKELSSEYFAQNLNKILESDEWKMFKHEKNELAFDFLESIAVEHASKTK